MSNERFEHRRQGDGELLGWIEERGEGFVAVNHFGWERTGVVNWFDAESVLDDLGLSYLAERYVYSADDGRILDVRIAEVREDAVVIKEAREPWACRRFSIASQLPSIQRCFACGEVW